MPWPALLAIAASGIFLARLLPQPLRTLRTGQVAGVSALAVMNAGVADAAWLAYGWSAGLVAVWLVSMPALVASAWTLLLLRTAVRRRDVAVAGCWLTAVVISALAGALTLVLAGAVVVCCGPAVRTAFSSRAPSGLSRWTWWRAVADASSWGAYGLVVGDRALELYGAVLLATAVALLVRLRATGPATRPTTNPANDPAIGLASAPAATAVAVTAVGAPVLLP